MHILIEIFEDLPSEVMLMGLLTIFVGMFFLASYHVTPKDRF